MAYMNQEMKKEKAPKIKAICKKYGVKGSLSVYHLSTLVLTISKGSIDFGTDYETINEYHINAHYPEGIIRNLFNELKEVMMEGNHNNSDIYTDYFDVGWYIQIQVGKWDKPYILIGA